MSRWSRWSRCPAAGMEGAKASKNEQKVLSFLVPRLRNLALGEL